VREELGQFKTKRSNKVETAHIWQVKYYIWLLELNGIVGVEAILEYPLLKQTQTVYLEETDKNYLTETIHKISALQKSEECPQKINSKICKNCSYYEFCYIDEA
jgi:CRISPR-associated exonuclease Cas4